MSVRCKAVTSRLAHTHRQARPISATHALEEYLYSRCVLSTICADCACLCVLAFVVVVSCFVAPPTTSIHFIAWLSWNSLSTASLRLFIQGAFVYWQSLNVRRAFCSLWCCRCRSLNARTIHRLYASRRRASPRRLVTAPVSARPLVSFFLLLSLLVIVMCTGIRFVPCI